MSLNVEKTGLILFNNNDNNEKFSFKLFGEKIPVVDHYEYLGIQIDNNVSLNKIGLSKKYCSINFFAEKGHRNINKLV